MSVGAEDMQEDSAEGSGSSSISPSTSTHGGQIARLTTSNDGPIEDAGEILPAMDDTTRTRLQVADAVGKLFLEAYNEVEPGKTVITWMKILNSPRSKVELVGFPVGCRSMTDGGMGKLLALPVSRNKMGQKRFELKLLDKQQLLYIESLLKSKKILFRIKQEQQ